MRQDRRLPESAVRGFGRDVACGLQYVRALVCAVEAPRSMRARRYVHSKGFLYCDLKPSNVLVNEFGALKLCDFGLAQLIPSPVREQNERVSPEA